MGQQNFQNTQTSFRLGQLGSAELQASIQVESFIAKKLLEDRKSAHPKYTNNYSNNLIAWHSTQCIEKALIGTAFLNAKGYSRVDIEKGMKGLAASKGHGKSSHHNLDKALQEYYHFCGPQLQSDDERLQLVQMEKYLFKEFPDICKNAEILTMISKHARYGRLTQNHFMSPVKVINPKTAEQVLNIATNMENKFLNSSKAQAQSAKQALQNPINKNTKPPTALPNLYHKMYMHIDEGLIKSNSMAAQMLLDIFNSKSNQLSSEMKTALKTYIAFYAYMTTELSFIYRCKNDLHMKDDSIFSITKRHNISDIANWINNLPGNSAEELAIRKDFDFLNIKDFLNFLADANNQRYSANSNNSINDLTYFKKALDQRLPFSKDIGTHSTDSRSKDLFDLWNSR